jgi:hypothetical protein
MAMVELQIIITRQNRVQLRRPNDDLLYLASLNAVFKSQNLLASQSCIAFFSFKCEIILKLKCEPEDQDEH